MAGGRFLVIVAIVVLASLSACTSGPEPAPGRRAAVEPLKLDVLVYNVEYDGDESTDAVIDTIDADVVGVLESYNRLPEMAENTGYPYHNVSLQLLSKYPIHEPAGADGRYALIEVRPGRGVALFNTHLDYVRFGPRLLANGVPVDEVVASENEIRTSALVDPLGRTGSLIEQGFPVFFTGDHNQPSSLDYGEATVGSRPGIDDAVPWPVSEALFDAGFRDTYREIHPDPIETPGVTHLPRDERIDFIYAAGPSKTLDSRLVGEEGGRDVQVGFEEWTSDHRAVVSTFELTPAPMEPTVTVDHSLLTQGDALTASYFAESGEGSLAVVTGDTMEVSHPLQGTSGRIEVDTSALAPGDHSVVVFDAQGAELSRVDFWLREPDAVIQVRTDRSTYRAGQPIEVSWEDGPANRWDWLGVYRASRSNPKVDSYLVWNYTGLHASGTTPPSTSGSVTMDEEAQGGPWPLPPGRYVVHYLVRDRYITVGSTRLQVLP